ncbi:MULTISPECIES: hypothetical protein [Rhodococcus erythropolis group]|uniref:hypothetical protein n=1 Tax=Rhodococcus erythropolis group TaxID=2840174 RepID=UPI00061B5EC9|nr:MULTISPECIES: hypothetical protein [Rhodococcus erythropolis group]AKE01289.1 hypothetical protein XU06_30585 [Rhodococcus erythropolis]MBW4818352.1 hypothetical protein [Rhodococcus qingshengii]MBY6389474.1 hypothetical protein [Rhodococcus erythropolis]MCW2295291.1 hypothetical protein [Rhodococcus erythropolis]
MSTQETGMIDIPALFVESFISFANDINDVELGDDDDVIGDLEFDVSEDGRRLYLANKCPGFYPYLQLASEVGGLAIAHIRSTDYVERDDGGFDEVPYDHAQVAIDLRNTHQAAREAVDCWIATF